MTGGTELFMGTIGGVTPGPATVGINGTALGANAWFCYFAFGMIRIVLQFTDEPIMPILPDVICRFFGSSHDTLLLLAMTIVWRIIFVINAAD
jgi:hypothetical protein